MKKIGDSIWPASQNSYFADYGHTFSNDDKVVLVADRGRKSTVIGTNRPGFPLLRKSGSEIMGCLIGQNF